MSDDWRLRATFTEHRQALELAQALQTGQLEHDLDTGAGGRVAVSLDDEQVFVYADTREQAERAGAAISSLAAAHSWPAQTELTRWHPEAETWEVPELPLPESGPELAAERAERIARERAESDSLGFPEYEVRVECASHGDTQALAERLAGEGVRSTRRWRYLLIGAADEESAKSLADRLVAEVPPGSTVTVEASLAAIAAETPPNPFAVFGGLAG
jgi:hypothetical protein